MLTQSSGEMSPTVRRDCYKHLGDLTLFNLGLFLKALLMAAARVSPDYYAEAGRRSLHHRCGDGRLQAQHNCLSQTIGTIRAVRLRFELVKVYY